MALQMRTSYLLLMGLIGVFLAMMIVSYLAFASAGRDLEQAQSNRYHSYLLADELRQSSDDLTRLARTYVVTGDERYEQQYFDILDIRNGKKPRPVDYTRIYWDFVAATDQKPRPDGETAALLDLMKAAGFTDAEFAKLTEATGNSDGLVALEVKAMNAVKGIFADAGGNYTVKGAPNLELARELMHSRQYHVFKAEVLKPIDDFFVMLDARTGGAVEESKSMAERYSWIMIGAMALVVGMVALSAWVVLTRMLSPIVGLRGIMSRLADNDQSVAVPDTSRHDEIGDMARAVQVFKDNMTEADRLRAAQDMERQRESDRAKRLETMVSGFDQMISKVVDAVSSSSADLEGTAKSMSVTAEETARQSNVVAAAAEEMTQNVQTVASATEQLSASIGEISTQVGESTRIVSAAVTQADETTARVKTLSDAAQKIGDVVTLINQIAGQTNLLALNATIEAARAGEMGKGFAVVASEVKNLANQTARATDEIAAQVRAIQESTESSADAIRDITQTVKRVSEISTAIASAVEQQSAATHEISRNVQQAATGTTEVSSNILGVTQASQQTSAGASQVLSAASELARNGTLLRQQVDSFLRDVRAG